MLLAPSAKRTKLATITNLALVAGALTILGTALAANAQMSIDWQTMDCGAATIAGGDYTLSGTVGQHDASPAITGGTGLAAYSLTGGFWSELPSHPPCAPDFNHDGELNPDDLGDYITCYFTQPPCPGADYNADHDINPDDLGDFITAYFQGC